MPQILDPQLWEATILVFTFLPSALLGPQNMHIIGTNYGLQKGDSQSLADTHNSKDLLKNASFLNKNSK